MVDPVPSSVGLGQTPHGPRFPRLVFFTASSVLFPPVTGIAAWLFETVVCFVCSCRIYFLGQLWKGALGPSLVLPPLSLYTHGESTLAPTILELSFKVKYICEKGSIAHSFAPWKILVQGSAPRTSAEVSSPGQLPGGGCSGRFDDFLGECPPCCTEEGAWGDH